MSMLIRNIQSRIRVDHNLRSAIESGFETIEVKKGETLLRENQYCRHLYFLEGGTVRTFLNHDGKDVTSWMYPENMFFTAWYSFLNQQPSFENIETLEPCIIHRINFDELSQLYNAYPMFERYGRLIAEEQLAFIDFFSKGYLFLSAKQKYDLLLSFFPDVTLRVKLGHIASFLGMSQETLSRIRSK